MRRLVAAKEKIREGLARKHVKLGRGRQISLVEPFSTSGIKLKLYKKDYSESCLANTILTYHVAISHDTSVT